MKSKKIIVSIVVCLIIAVIAVFVVPSSVMKWRLSSGNNTFLWFSFTLSFYIVF